LIVASEVGMSWIIKHTLLVEIQVLIKTMP